MPALPPPADGSSPNTGPLTSLLAGLSATDVELAALTGGVAAADVLTEFARASALELAHYFEDLPNRAFNGIVPRTPGWRGWLRRSRTVRHRVLAVRYTSAEQALSIGSNLLSFYVMGFLLAIGEDGMLRTGAINEEISIDSSSTIPDIALPFFDERVRNVPTSRTKMRDWLGGNDPAQVAPPEAVLELLRLSATGCMSRGRHKERYCDGYWVRSLDVPVQCIANMCRDGNCTQDAALRVPNVAVAGVVRTIPSLSKLSTMIRATTILVMLLLGAVKVSAQTVAAITPRDTSPIAVVRAYVAAFNAKDLKAMMAHVAPGMVWLNVEGDSTTLGGRGVDAFQRLLAGYFREVPSAQSELLAVRALGPWVTTHERTRWRTQAAEAGGQSSVAVYEVRAGLVQRVWYYPAEP